MDWRDTSRRQCGAITTRQLAAHGLTNNAVRNLVIRGHLERHSRGVFVVGGADVNHSTELWIAILRTDGLLGFETAGHLWAVADRPADIDIVVPDDKHVRPAPPRIRVHRTFVPRSARTSIAGMPVTTRIWTILDLLGSLPPAQGQRLADRALQRSWLTRDDIQRRLDDYPCRTGNRALRRIHAVTADGAAAPSERIVHRLLREAGIRNWTANHEVWLGGTLVAILDVAIVARRVAIEVDGWAYHSDVDRFVRDRRRQNALVMAGWTVLRFSWADLTERPQSVVAQLRRVAS